QAVFDRLTNLGTAVVTQRRTLSHLRSFWRHLAETGVVPATVDPLRSIRLGGKRTKAAQSRSYVPFTPAEVAHLYKAAVEKDDNTLANLILLAAYTGARIEE